MFCETLSIGMSKLAVLVRLKTSKRVPHRDALGDLAWSSRCEMSARLCQDCRKMLRWPLVMKLVSYVIVRGNRATQIARSRAAAR